MNAIDNCRRFRKTKNGLLVNLYHKMKNRKGVDFTLAEFRQLYLFNRKFNELFNAWVKSGYKKALKPSIDRINFRLPYKINNMQLMTWEQNRRKGNIEVAIQRMRPVIMRDINGGFVHKFDSIKSAVSITGYRQGLISACLSGKRRKTGNFEFQYAGVHENPELSR